VRLGQGAEVCERFVRFEAPISSALARLYDLHHYLSSKKAAQELGYRPRPLEDSLRDTLAWLKKHRHVS
jgi:nucleoside-diphosphate-sugar epimerase